MAENEDIVTRVPPVKNRGGVWVRLGMEEYRIPPLGFGAIQELQQRIDVLQGMTGVPNKEQLGMITEVIQMAMQRNYPDITLDEVRDKLDMGNFSAVLDAVLNLSGYKRGAPGEAEPASR